MCFDIDSSPPSPGLSVQPASTASVAITSADGTLFAAFLARPERPSGAGIVILPDMRGLFRFYELLAQRLAEQGHTALAIDYFGRSAGVGRREEGFPYKEHIFRVTRETIDADIEAAANYLRGSGLDCRAMFALGFCFGGRHAFFSSAARFGFDGVVGFYGMPGLYPNGSAGPAQHAAELSAPILGIFGGADHGISSNEIDAFDEALKAAGVPHDFVIYPGAGHSFFDVKYEEHAAACSDAWDRVLAFIRERSGSAVRDRVS